MELNIISKHRNAIMGFAALWIFYFHTAPLLFINTPVISNIEWFLKRTGYCGVDIFLLLLSYGLYFSFSKTDVFKPLEYIKKRLFRILPSYIAVLFFQCAVFGLGIKYFFKTLIFITQFGKNMYLFLWFVPCVLIFYAFAPFYFFCFKKVKFKLAFTAALIFIICFLCKKYGYMVRHDLYCIISRIPVFISGFLMGYITEKGIKITPAVLILSAAAVFFSMYTDYLLNMGLKELFLPYENCFVNIFAAWGFSILIPYFFESFSANLFVNAIKCIIVFYGKISFQFYCVQEFINKLMCSLFFNGFLPEGRKSALLVFILVFILSTLSALALNKCEKKIKRDI